MRRTNINAMLRMVRRYLDGEMSKIDFVLDFPYEMEKRYQKMLNEDEDYADMMYCYLIECGTDKAEGMSNDAFKQLMQKQYDEVMDNVY